MIVEYLSDGSPDCPLIRFYGTDVHDFMRLRDICASMSSNQLEYDISLEKSFVVEGMVSLQFKDDGNEGASVKEGYGEWRLTPKNWNIASQLIDALIEVPVADGDEFYQWASGNLSQPPLPSSGLPVLISRTSNGAW